MWPDHMPGTRKGEEMSAYIIQKYKLTRWEIQQIESGQRALEDIIKEKEAKWNTRPKSKDRIIMINMMMVASIIYCLIGAAKARQNWAVATMLFGVVLAIYIFAWNNNIALRTKKKRS